MPGGRPTTYRPEYCQMLIEHMRGGNSLEAFGAVAHCSIQTLYDWLDRHEEFAEARKDGMSYLHQYYENMGKMIAMGQARRLVSEKPALDKDGKLIFDEAGKAMYERTYEPATSNATAWIFLTKNILGWRNEKHIFLNDTKDAPTTLANISDEELLARFKKLADKVKAIGPPPKELNAGKAKRG